LEADRDIEVAIENWDCLRNALARRLQWKKFALPATDAYSRVYQVTPIGGIFQGIHSPLAAYRSILLRARAHSCSWAIECFTRTGTQADSGLHFNRVGYADAVDDGLPEPGRSKNKSRAGFVFACGHGCAAGGAEAFERLPCADRASAG